MVKKDDEVTELKRKLAQCGDAKERFNASTDFAAINLREFRSACSARIIEGLKSQFSSIPKLEAIKNISAQLTGLEALPTLVKDMSTKLDELKNLPGIVQSLQTSVDEASETISSVDDGIAVEAETAICFQNRLVKLLAGYGFKMEAGSFDIPQALTEILTRDRQRLPTVLFTCDCGCGKTWTSLDTSIPPPSISTEPSSLVGVHLYYIHVSDKHCLRA